jgi:hypothetical protein
MGQVPAVRIPQISTTANLRLRWGEWLSIALPSSVAVAIAIEAVLLSAATAWFGDPGRALVPLAPLIVILMLGAILLRLCDTIAWLRPLYRPVLLAGIIITALALIHARIFPALAVNDWSWLASFANITDVYAEQPHTELGLIALSVALWLFAERQMQNAGEYEQRRAAFLRLFAVMVGAVLVGIWSAHGNDRLSIDLALLLPVYVLCGLVMMAQVRLAEMRARLMRGGNADRRSLRIWHLATAGFIGATLLLVFIGTAIFFRGAYADALAALGDVVTTLLDIAALVLGILTLPFVLLLSNFVGPLKPPSQTGNGGTCLSGTPAPSVTPVPSATLIPNGGAACAQKGQPPPLSAATTHEIYAIILVAVLASVAVFLLLRALWQRKERPPEEYEEFREALNVRARLPTPRAALVHAIEPPPPGSVRAIYRDFLQRGARVGLAREADETPAEYAARIEPVLEMADVDPPVVAVMDLTDAYEEERYGAVAPTPSRLAQAQEAFKRIAASLGNLVRAKPPGGASHG